MRVALLNPIGEVGGAERVLLAVLQSLRARFEGLEVLLVTLSDGPLLDEARALGAQAVSLDASEVVASLGESRGAIGAIAGSLLAAPRIVSLARRQRDAVGSFGPDVVHSFGLKTHLLLALAPVEGAKAVWQVQDFYSTRRLSRTLAPWAARSADHAMAVSAAVADDTRRLLPRLATTAIDNAVDTERFTPEGPSVDLDALARLPPAAAGTVRVGLVATYARWKGHRVFLEAARRVLDSRPPAAVRFYVVGGPIYDTAGQWTPAELANYARSLGVDTHVGFVPFQGDTAAVYRALDVVVHASTQPEPFGLVIVEGMACGRGVVVSAAGGAADLFTEGHDALGHAPGDATGLATAVRRLVEDRDLRRRLGENAAVTARERFGMVRYADQVAAVYRGLLRK